jgi:hypothetical protein
MHYFCFCCPVVGMSKHAIKTLISIFPIFFAAMLDNQPRLALSSDDLPLGIHHHVAQAVFSLPFAHVSGVQASHRLL